MVKLKMPRFAAMVGFLAGLRAYGIGGRPTWRHSYRIICLSYVEVRLSIGLILFYSDLHAMKKATTSLVNCL